MGPILKWALAGVGLAVGAGAAGYTYGRCTRDEPQRVHGKKGKKAKAKAKKAKVKAKAAVKHLRKIVAQAKQGKTTKAKAFAAVNNAVSKIAAAKAAEQQV